MFRNLHFLRPYKSSCLTFTLSSSQQMLGVFGYPPFFAQLCASGEVHHRARGLGLTALRQSWFSHLPSQKLALKSFRMSFWLVKLRSLQVAPRKNCLAPNKRYKGKDGLFFFRQNCIQIWSLALEAATVDSNRKIALQISSRTLLFRKSKNNFAKFKCYNLVKPPKSEYQGGDGNEPAP